jgi:hypothetical protein
MLRGCHAVPPGIVFYLLMPRSESPLLSFNLAIELLGTYVTLLWAPMRTSFFQAFLPLLQLLVDACEKGSHAFFNICPPQVKLADVSHSG